MQIVSRGDNLHELSKIYFLGNIRKISSVLSSAESVQRAIKDLSLFVNSYYQLNVWFEITVV